MFEGLTKNLVGLFNKLKGNKLTESNLSDALNEVRMALLSADVHFKIARQFVESIRDKCVGQKIIDGISAKEQFIKIIHDEIIELLGNTSVEFGKDEKFLKILMLGLHGSGKTTTSVKLAIHLQKKGYKPAVVACDIYRPAAIDQLETLAKQRSIPFFCKRESQNVKEIAKNAIEWSENLSYNAIIFDTAGRLQIDTKLIDELKTLKTLINPQESLLVADSALGQEAVNIAKTFHEAIDVSGIVLTKLDGDARGGAAISMKISTGIPIKFIGLGEKLDDFQIFHPDRIADRILGMGDIVSLVEQTIEKIEEKDAQELSDRMQAKDFNLDDLLAQFRQMKKMGPLSSIAKMLPGMPSVDTSDPKHESKMKQMEAILLSMTKKERHMPQIINSSRRFRIAKGSGVELKDVNGLLKQFEQMSKFVRIMKNPNEKNRIMDSLSGLFGKKF